MLFENVSDPFLFNAERKLFGEMCLVIKESVTNDQYKFSISFNLKWKEIRLPVFLM